MPCSSVVLASSLTSRECVRKLLVQLARNPNTLAASPVEGIRASPVRKNQAATPFVADIGDQVVYQPWRSIAELVRKNASPESADDVVVGGAARHETIEMFIGSGTMFVVAATATVKETG